MGTSQSSIGPSGKSPIIPPWADPQILDPSDGEQSSPQMAQPVYEPARFKGFRQSVGGYSSNNGSKDLKNALKNYATKSTGGKQYAPARSTGATKAGANLFGALLGAISVTSSSPNTATINLSNYTGLPCELAISQISEALTPQDGDSSIIRASMNHALVEALSGIKTFDTNSITDEVITNTMVAYMTEHLFLKIVQDAGKAWQKYDDPMQAVKVEQELRMLIKVSVDLTLSPKLDNLSQISVADMQDIENAALKEVWDIWSKY